MNRLSEERMEQLFACFRTSMTARAAARSVGTSKDTANRYLRLMEHTEQTSSLCACGKPRHVGWCRAQENAERVETLCACGKSIRHRGWCSVRFERSPARQRFMLRWHPPKDQPAGDTVAPVAVTQTTPLLPIARFVTMAPLLPREKQDLRAMLAEAVANTRRMQPLEAD
jgi:hypothetical protein